MSRHEASSTSFIDRAKEHGTKFVAGTLIAIGAVGLAGCASNAEAQPSPTQSASAEASPSATPSKAPETPSPSATEVDNQPSGIVVDVASFDNWDNKPKSLTPVAVYGMEGSKEWTCDQFFMANGLPGNREVTPTSGWDGKKISDWFGPRLDLVWKLNLDKSNPKYEEIADNLLQCLTSQHLGTESNGSGITSTNDAYTMLKGAMFSARHSGDGINPLEDMSTILRQSSGTWYNGQFNQYSVEYKGREVFGQTEKPIATYEFTNSNDYRLVGLYIDSNAQVQFDK